MSFWKTKKEDKLYQVLLKKYELVEAMLKVLEKDIELINIKLRKRAYKEPHSDEKGKADSEVTRIDDGFDELRKIKKELPSYY